MNIPIYDGDPIWNPKAVPFGFYNNDVEFQEDCIKVTKFCATRLGYPLMDIELQSSSFFTAFDIFYFLKFRGLTFYFFNNGIP